MKHSLTAWEDTNVVAARGSSPDYGIRAGSGLVRPGDCPWRSLQTAIPFDQIPIPLEVRQGEVNHLRRLGDRCGRVPESDIRPACHLGPLPTLRQGRCNRRCPSVSTLMPSGCPTSAPCRSAKWRGLPTVPSFQHVKDSYVMLGRVVHVQQGLIGRKAQAVGKDHVVVQQGQFPRIGIQTVHALVVQVFLQVLPGGPPGGTRWTGSVK